MTDPSHLSIRRLVSSVLVMLAASITFGGTMLGNEEAIPTRGAWADDGTYRITETIKEVSTSVDTRPVFDLAGHRTVGLTFRSPAARIDAVEFHLGVPGVVNAPTSLQLVLRKGERDGPIVARRTYTTEQLPPKGHWLKVELNQTCEPGSLWTAEIRLDDPVTHSRRMHLHHGLRGLPAAPWVHGGYADGEALDSVFWVQVTGERTSSVNLAGKRIFWAAPPDRRLTVDVGRSAQVIADDTPDAPITLSAVRGEAVSIWLGVSARPEDHASRYELLVTDLQDDQGNTPARVSRSIEWLRNVAVYRVDPGNGEVSRDGVFSDVLASRASARPDNLNAPSNVAWLVTWRIPRHVQPGRYEARVIYMADGDQASRRTVELQIRTPVVPLKKTFRTALFSTFNGYINPEIGLEYPLYSDENFQVREWFRRTLADSRISLSSLRIWHQQFMEQTPPPGGTSDDVWNNRFIQDAIVEVAHQLKREGFALEHLTPWHELYEAFKGHRAGREKVKRFWNNYYPLLEQRGWLDDAWTRLPDEFATDEEIDRAVEYVKWFRTFAPDVKIMTTAMGWGEARYRLADYVDIWCPVVNEYLRFREFYRERLTAGDQVWPYIHYHCYVGAEDYRIRGYFWWLYFQGVNGCTYYSVGPRGKHRQKTYGIRQESDMPRGDGNILYAAPGELWRSIRLARIADGIEDWELLHQMAELSREAITAATITAELQQRVDQFHSRGERFFERPEGLNLQPQQFNAMRGELIEIIEQLRAVGGAGP